MSITSIAQAAAAVATHQTTVKPAPQHQAKETSVKPAGDQAKLSTATKIGRGAASTGVALIAGTYAAIPTTRLAVAAVKGFEYAPKFRFAHEFTAFAGGAVGAAIGLQSKDAKKAAVQGALYGAGVSIATAAAWTLLTKGKGGEALRAATFSGVVGGLSGAGSAWVAQKMSHAKFWK